MTLRYHVSGYERRQEIFTVTCGERTLGTVTRQREAVGHPKDPRTGRKNPNRTTYAFRWYARAVDGRYLGPHVSRAAAGAALAAAEPGGQGTSTP